MTLKKFFFVVTASQNWGRGITLEAAYKAANVKHLLKDHHVVYTGVVKNEATDEQVANLLKCWNVMGDGSVRYLDDPSKKDVAMRKKFFIGWLEEEMGKPKK